MFGFGDSSGAGEYLTPPQKKGNHGLWPTLPGYRSVFLLHGAGTNPRSLGEIQMLSIKDRLGARLVKTAWVLVSGFNVDNNFH
jgi:hypothetical protein